MTELLLATGATMRRTGPARGRLVVCVDGGVASVRQPGDWSASLEWLVGHVAPRLPELAFYEVRYRIKSWNRLDLCIADAQAAIEAVADGSPHGAPGASDTPACALVGFSMGGAVAIASAGHPAVRQVVGLAPWIPERLDVSGLDGRRFSAFHGALDAYLPGIPGVSAASSRKGYARIRARGVEGRYELISGAIHPVAVRLPWGLQPLPRAGRWADLVTEELASLQTAG